MKGMFIGAALVLGVLQAGCQAPEAISTSAPFVHVVLFQAKPNVPGTALEDMLRDLRVELAPIPVVKAMWVGQPAPTKTPERPFVIDDYDVGLLIVVEDQKGLNDYLYDPRHEAFVKRHGPNFDVRVIDFTPRTSATREPAQPAAAP
jgi:hypothetical protein